MEEEIYLSTHEGIEALSSDGSLLRAAGMEGAGALCAGGNSLFCAGADGAVWQLERRTLMPRAILPGGPGLCDLLLSPDGARLYALLGEADSILMSDAHSGRALVVNRCGCNPQHMALHEGVLAAAGAESGCVHLFDPETLTGRGEIPMPGPVYAVALRAGYIFALCLTPQLDTILVRQKGACRETLLLAGMPGSLCLNGAVMLAATHGWLHVFSVEEFRLLSRRKAPGRASRLAVMKDRVLLYDPLSACAWMLRDGEAWRMHRAGVHALAVQ